MSIFRNIFSRFKVDQVQLPRYVQ